MRHLVLIIILMAVGAAAAANDLWHPDAYGVQIAGPGDTTALVCYWHDGTGKPIAPNPRPTGGEFRCDEVPLSGAQVPTQVDFPDAGPVRVINAKWGMAETDLGLVPMAVD